jgi:hypothetical protein
LILIPPGGFTLSLSAQGLSLLGFKCGVARRGNVMVDTIDNKKTLSPLISADKIKGLKRRGHSAEDNPSKRQLEKKKPEQQVDEVNLDSKNTAEKERVLKNVAAPDISQDEKTDSATPGKIIDIHV